ncbi:hypothetical protein VTL71DRAFT_7924 [Oculimacula yallundae]|uniref:Uncharacterized protein n=1 Tax=Oculimacula yallundae TaxID=86028 RepID=A0ABR4CYE2_9HELO
MDSTLATAAGCVTSFVDQHPGRAWGLESFGDRATDDSNGESSDQNILEVDEKNANICNARVFSDTAN